MHYFSSIIELLLSPDNEFFLLSDLDRDISSFRGSYPINVELTFGFCTLMFMIFYNLDYLLLFLRSFYLFRLEREEFKELILLFNSKVFLLFFNIDELTILGLLTFNFIICYKRDYFL